jgi:UDP-glucose 4-epimerase
MNVLVTGGAGYIGSHATRALIQAGHKVVVLDNLSHGHREAVEKSATFVQGDVADQKLVLKLLLENKIEAVMHFAADIEVGESVANPNKYYLNNFVSPLSLLNSMREAGVKKIVFSSTAAVYGNPVEIPITEAHPRQAMSPYGRSKLMMEFALEDFARAYGLGFIVLRYFNVAGAHPDGTIGEDHQPESHLIPRILLAARNPDFTLPIYGTDYNTPDGTCVRDYIHVQDLVAAHILALQKIQLGAGTAYNLGSESGFTVREVIKACERVTNRKIPTIEHDRRPGDPDKLVASSDKIRRELGWVRQYPDLETIIGHAWTWHCNFPQGFSTP